ncbi:hypothetical protein MettiDRAFT_1413 [Methanolobus tindarius DSM 2278]|uniref:Uncharacterized protein n=1 Tax=Methanolobus tindarius DSM 2278 TaxID=1090322 RepID=W9DWA3_METTI|nr:hypothetical protein MettiDRAFT_1413 [Methanolobus tindarius DSM 2278]
MYVSFDRMVLCDLAVGTLGSHGLSLFVGVITKKHINLFSCYGQRFKLWGIKSKKYSFIRNLFILSFRLH